eukprot:gene26749-33375_t
MTRFRAINISDPEKGRMIFTQGEALVSLAAKGEFLGADVDAVAENDVMPLNVANSLPESSEKKAEIVSKLLSCGAKTTWRRQNAPKVSFSGGSGGSSENTSMSVVSSSGGRFAQPVVTTFTVPIEKKQYVKFTGGDNTLPSPPFPSPPPKKQFVKFTGGGDVSGEHVLTAGVSEIRLGSDVVEEEKDAGGGASYRTGNDGAMLFSTGD